MALTPVAWAVVTGPLTAETSMETNPRATNRARPSERDIAARAQYLPKANAATKASAIPVQ